MLESTGSGYSDFEEFQLSNFLKKANNDDAGYKKPETSVNSADFDPSARLITSEKKSDYFTLQIK